MFSSPSTNDGNESLNDKETMRRVTQELRPDIDDAEFEVIWLLYIAGKPR